MPPPARSPVAIIGQGYVGLPLALAFCEAGFSVVGIDTDPDKVVALRAGRSCIHHIGADRLAAAIASGRYEATGDVARVSSCGAVVICVPTPLGRHREPDTSFIRATAKSLVPHLRRGHLVVLESTTYPGTTDDELLPLLESSGLRCPRDFLLAYSPEREDPGNPSFHTRNIPKVVGGVNGPSTDAAVALYAAVVERVVPVSSARVAEAAKLVENVYRAVNIALVNELKLALDGMGLDVWEVIDAASTKPFGFTPFYPGPGLGGHCIPVDPCYLSWKAAEHGVSTQLIQLAGLINTEMPRQVARKVEQALGDDGKAIRGARVLVLGLSYKADIDDDRESPSYDVIELLAARGARVDCCDPHFPAARKTRRHDLGLRSVPCTAGCFAEYDALVLCTAHREFSDPSLYAAVRLVVDTRNAMATWGAAPGRVVKA